MLYQNEGSGYYFLGRISKDFFSSNSLLRLFDFFIVFFVDFVIELKGGEGYGILWGENSG